MIFRKAVIEDLPNIVQLLADDELGTTRERYETPLPDSYIEAFNAIEAQVGNQLLLAVEGASIIGCLQLTIIPGLARQGMKRAQIEGVRVAQNQRGTQIGEALFKEAMAIAKAEHCGLVQLTTDKKRKDAHRFYARLGFIASHEGMKFICP
ncbi:MULTISPECIES: GNAT family N-acetyltransferase [Planococcus]|uniref:GNAT family N-acetyltransferase n=1 Tax=Planococcus faecalis TaxID=1598147 RepID=A0ABM6IW01_9BACL|nr:MULTISPECIES: GNAT family N-acetyltransferase [Planococcus]AQU80748.1 GNAT family N-acetyltransferase [Planococcus faecalis]MDJ0331964.1 GNAT family N-acetyltransferase [Planococcus sp. S3-L1]OHX55739.1 GNAT family acetyltransferase [Planococcus faecalis]